MQKKCYTMGGDRFSAAKRLNCPNVRTCPNKRLTCIPQPSYLFPNEKGNDNPWPLCGILTYMTLMEAWHR